MLGNISKTFSVMTMLKSNFFRSVTTIMAVLIVYLLLRSGLYIYALIYTSESSFLIAARTLALVSYFVLAYLTYRRNIIAGWAMVFFLFLSGISSILFGLFAVPIAQYILKLFGVILGAYFLYGGIILFKSIRKGEMRGIDSLMKKA